MSFFQTVAGLLEERLGVSPATMGMETISRAVQRHMRALGVTCEKAYLEHLRTSPRGWEELTEEVVVPETWFFRNAEAFAFLVRTLTENWRPAHEDGIVRILSVPCASGEEPYSIAMALLDGGVRRHRFEIDAMDISVRAIQKAECRLYGRESFRGTQNDAFRKRHFEEEGDQWRLLPHLAEAVRFMCGNVLDPGLLDQRAPYDVIFCRNLLIYFTDRARLRTVKRLERLLAPQGILFAGHVETSIFMEHGFSKVNEPSVFACRKTSSLSSQAPPSIHRAYQGHGTLESCRVDMERLAVCSGAAGGTAFVPPRSVSASGVSNDKGQERQTSHPPDACAEGPAAAFERARILADGGSLCDALVECEKAVSRDALNVPAHFLMGLVYQAMNQPEKAGACFRKVLYLAPDHVEAIEHMALLAEERGDLGEAERLRRRGRRNHGRTGCD